MTHSHEEQEPISLEQRLQGAAPRSPDLDREMLHRLAEDLRETPSLARTDRSSRWGRSVANWLFGATAGAVVMFVCLNVWSSADTTSTDVKVAAPEERETPSEPKDELDRVESIEPRSPVREVADPLESRPSRPLRQGERWAGRARNLEGLALANWNADAFQECGGVLSAMGVSPPVAPSADWSPGSRPPLSDDAFSPSNPYGVRDTTRALEELTGRTL